MTEQNQFDVFFAHNSVDKPQVRTIANKIKEQGLRPWLDEEQIAAGELFQDAIQKAFPKIKSAAIFIGAKGLGKWQVIELQTLISQFIDRGIPVIPVLLPEVDQIPDELPFLKQFNWVRFASINDASALYNLECGIKGYTPSEYLQNMRNKLADLTSRKDILNKEIEEIEKKLNSIVSLESRINPNLKSLLNWLSEGERIAKRCCDQALKKFPSLRQEVKTKDNLDVFYQEISCYLEFLYASIETDNMIFLNNPALPLTLNSDIYEFSCFDVYEETFEIIKSKIPDYIDDSINKKFRDHVDYMIRMFRD